MGGQSKVPLARSAQRLSVDPFRLRFDATANTVARESRCRLARKLGFQDLASNTENGVFNPFVEDALYGSPSVSVYRDRR